MLCHLISVAYWLLLRFSSLEYCSNVNHVDWLLFYCMFLIFNIIDHLLVVGTPAYWFALCPIMLLRRAQVGGPGHALCHSRRKKIFCYFGKESAGFFKGKKCYKQLEDDFWHASHIVATKRATWGLWGGHALMVHCGRPKEEDFFALRILLRGSVGR